MFMPRTNTLRIMSSVLVLTALMSANRAEAQNISGPADVSRVQERAVQPTITQPAPDMISVEGPVTAEVPAGADKAMLTLSEVTFDGLSVYTPAQLESFYSAQIGQKISVADVYRIAAEVTRKFRNDGYILTQVVVPPQTIDDGKIRLQVVEGTIDNVTVDGVDTETERALMLSYAESLKGKPLNTRELEQATLLINDLPGVSARSIISPSTKVPGAADLRVLVERKKYDVQIGLDNYGSRFLGPLEGQASVSGNSLLGMNERLTADFVYAPGGGISKELAYGDLIYNQPIGSHGATVQLMASVASTDPGFTLSEFDVNGHASTYSVKLEQPIIRTRALNWKVSAMFDARNASTQSNIDETRKDYIRALRFGTEGDFLDSILGVGYNTFSTELSQGLDVFGASSSGDANLSRADGEPQFTKITAELQRLQRINRNINLLLAARGQIASGAMLSSEEFGFGGPNYGRGYDPSEIVGDDGIAGKVEVQFVEPIETNLVSTYQLYGFLDGGRVWNDDATSAADERISAVSTGVGIRATLNTGTNAGLYVAQPLTRDVETLGNKDPRVFFNLSHRF